MSETIRYAAEWCAVLVEALGIAVVTVTAIYTIVFLITKLLAARTDEDIFQSVRRRLGRGILLGLEFLVAGDIIHTVAVDLTFQTVGVLAVIVAIRTFLSFTLEVELTGRWPWQHKSS